MLNAVTHGAPGARPPLLIAHGLFGSARNWGVIAKRLSAERQVVAVDMRNHGLSDWRDTNSYTEMADDLAEFLAMHMPGPCDVLGHSMGGKATMVLALTRPELIRRVVVADIAPVGYSHTQMHMIEAMRAVDLTQVERRSDADDQLAGHVDEPGVRSFLLQSLDVKEKRWRFNLDVLAAEMDRIIGFPDVDGACEAPVLFLSGGASDYVRREHRPKIKTHFPNARFAKIPGAGHWLHAEEPRGFEETVRIYLDS